MSDDFMPFTTSQQVSKLSAVYRTVFMKIRKCMDGEPPMLLLAPRELTRITGSIESSLLLSQILYWSDRTENDEGWIYKTYQEWHEEIGLKICRIKTARENLESMGIISTKVKKTYRGVPTIHYRLLIGNLLQIIDDYYTGLKKKE